MTPLETFLAVYICMSGPSCPSVPIVGSSAKYSMQSCEADARLVAQGMFVSSGNKYGFRCDRVEYEPPNLGAVAK